jgi:hypothetical protein
MESTGAAALTGEAATASKQLQGRWTNSKMPGQTGGTRNSRPSSRKSDEPRRPVADIALNDSAKR